VTTLGHTFFQAAGGKGANQAVAAARAGRSRVVFIAAVGDDAFGRSSLDSLCRDHLLLDYVVIIPNCSSGVALILVDDVGENSIAVVPGANGQLSPDHVDRVPDEVFGSANVFLASLETPLATVQRGLERARAGGLTTILNPAPIASRDGILKLLPLVDVLTPNEHEASELLDRHVDAWSAAEAARDLVNLGCRNAVITLGSAGAVWASADDAWHCPAFAVTPVDTTAAGDALSGALAVALAEGSRPRAALRFASAAAAVAVTRAGAQPSLARREEIEELLESTP
jgi:ribokinase